MNTIHKCYAIRHVILVFIIGFAVLSISYASRLPEVISKLYVDIGSLKIVPINSSKSKIYGRVEAARWGGYDTYKEKDPSRRIYYDRYGKRIRPNDRFFRKYPDKFRIFVASHTDPEITKKGGMYYGSYRPSKIRIFIPYLSRKSEADVLTDGQFSGYLELKDGYYLSKDPNVTVNPGYCWWKTKRKIVFVPENPKKLGSFGDYDDGYRRKITLYFIDVNDSLAKGLLTKVRVEFAEKNSRVPVKPDIRITMKDGPTFDLIKAEWEKKYGAPAVKKLEKTYRTTMKKRGVRRVLKKGDVEEVKNQEAVEFWAFIGSSFKLETRDRNFYYFQGVFKADKALLTKKTVLLIEIGDKLRLDDEGHGGQIISD